MFENSPTRSCTIVDTGSGSPGSRPVKASNRPFARRSGSVHETDPVSGPCSNRTVATSHPRTCVEATPNDRSSLGSATAKKLCSATLRTASNIADAASGSVSFGKFVVREFVEDISQYLRAERFFQITPDVEVRGLFAAHRRTVGRNNHAAQAAPALVHRDLTQHLGAGHHG